ncbi:MAG: hypothetical protein OXC26_19255 [Albidovulum sp.]|nr:hypothetical protein [Albidovulum sp.]
MPSDLWERHLREVEAGALNREVDLKEGMQKNEHVLASINECREVVLEAIRRLRIACHGMCSMIWVKVRLPEYIAFSFSTVQDRRESDLQEGAVQIGNTRNH